MKRGFFPQIARIFADDFGNSIGVNLRTTFLHKLGHYLGSDEEGLTARGLEWIFAVQPSAARAKNETPIEF